MLDTFTLENYKAFRSAAFELKPLTVLLGSNGVGKTAIIRFLMMLHQTSQGMSSSALGPIIVNGDFVEMGEARKLIRQYNSRNDWAFSIGVPVREFRHIVSGLKQTVADLISDNTEQLAFYIDAASRKGDNDLFTTSAQFQAVRERFAQHRRPQRRGPHDFDEVADFYEQMLELTDSLGQDFFDASGTTNELTLLDYNWISRNNLRRHLGVVPRGQPLTRTELSGLRRFLGAIDGLPDLAVSVKLSLRLTADQKNFIVRVITVRQKGNSVLSVNFGAAGEVTKVSSDLLPDSYIDKYHQPLSQAFNPKRPLFQWIDPSAATASFTAFIFASLLSRALSFCESEIDSADFYHVAPIRPFLDRYISSHRSRDALTIQGARLIDRLADKEVRKSVDKWFREFDISFEVNEITELLKELVTVQRKGRVHLSINDVGFGYSQVLPIIIEGTTRPEDSLTMIEQPEVHLHPKMQAKLADFFIEASGVSQKMQLDGKKRYFLIETHSENILKRLRRRIAEGAISNEDVAIYFLEDEPGGNIVKRIAVEPDGNIDWPRDFYATDLEDTAAFFRASVGRSVRKPAGSR